MQERTCPICGTTFTPESSGRVYCGKQCKKRAENAANRGSDPRAPMLEPYDCAQCGEPCVPGETVVAHASRFCSRRCKRAWHAKNVEAPALLFRSVTAQATPYQVTAYKRALKDDPCPYCGQTPSNGIDHIQPKAEKGTNAWANLTGCCSRCNAVKQTLPLLAALVFVPVSREYNDLRKTLWPPRPRGVTPKIA